MGTYKNVLEVVTLFELKRIYSSDTTYGCINKWSEDENGKLHEIEWKVEVDFKQEDSKEKTMEKACSK